MICLNTIATVLGYSHWCSCHWDEALVRRRGAATWAPQLAQVWQRIWPGYNVWLRQWRVPDGKDDPPLMMLQTMLMGATPRVGDPATEDEVRTDDLR